MEGQALWDHTKHLLGSLFPRDHLPWWWQTSHDLRTLDKTLASLLVQKEGRSLTQVSGEAPPAGRTLEGDGVTKRGRARRRRRPGSRPLPASGGLKAVVLVYSGGHK